MPKLTRMCIVVGMLIGWTSAVHAIPVDLELILAQDVSGSITTTDFNLSRGGIEAAFRSSGVISAIEDGLIGSIAVALWDFADGHAVAVDWTLITDSITSNAFADAVAAAPRGVSGGGDGQVNVINNALTALNTNNFEGTRSVLDIASEGVQSGAGCVHTSPVCPAVQTARDAFLAGGGTAINAIWLNDRDFFGLDPEDAVNAFEYGTLSLIGGPGSFQSFAFDFTDFGPAIEDKLLREIRPPDGTPSEVPEPGTLILLSGGLFLIVAGRKRFARTR